MIIDLIKAKIYPRVFNKDKITLHITEGENYYSICYNSMGTGIHIPKEEVDEDECREFDIKIWKTWEFKN